MMSMEGSAMPTFHKIMADFSAAWYQSASQPFLSLITWGTEAQNEAPPAPVDRAR